MALQGWLQIALTLLIAFLISIPVGRYLAKIFTDQRTLVDPLFDPIDNFLYRLIGRKAVTQPMNWKLYTVHMLVTNMIMTVFIFLISGVPRLPSAQSNSFRRCQALTSIQYSDQFHDQYGLAELWWGDHHVQLQPDGCADFSHVHFSYHRLCRGDGIHPFLHRHRRRSQFGEFLS